jgi:CRP/FNR family transcriptional regulator, cyclic AMP receptor protein
MPKSPSESSSRAAPSLSDMIRASQWAHDLTEEEIARAEAGTIERAIPAGGYLCHKGDATEHWIGIVAGLAKVSNFSFEGKVITFTGVPPGGWFGEGSILKNEARRYDAFALQDARVAYMNKAAFLWLLDHSIPFNRFLITQLNERLGQAFTSLESQRLLGPDGRVARCLIALFNPVLYPGLDRQLQISQEELGYLTGLSRQRVNQALHTLQDHGWVKVKYGRIEILDFDRLRTFSD